MKKINVTYIDTNDEYKALWGMTKAQLIQIIKDDDKTINRLNKRY